MKKKKILGTTVKPPFTIVKCEAEGREKYFIACGKMKNEKMYSSFEEAEKAIKRKDWELITLLMEQFVTWLMDSQSKK